MVLKWTVSESCNSLLPHTAFKAINWIIHSSNLAFCWSVGVRAQQKEHFSYVCRREMKWGEEGGSNGGEQELKLKPSGLIKWITDRCLSDFEYNSIDPPFITVNTVMLVTFVHNRPVFLKLCSSGDSSLLMLWNTSGCSETNTGYVDFSKPQGIFTSPTLT